MMTYDIKKMYAWSFSLRLMILGLSAILILILFYFIDISSLKAQIIYNKQQIEDLKRQVTTLLNKKNSFSNEIARFDKLKVTQKEWQERMIDKSTFSGLLDTILKYGESNNLKFTTFSPSNEIHENTFIKVPIKIEMKGSYVDIVTFLSQIINMKKMIYIGDFSITTNNPNEVRTEKLSSITSDELLNADLTLEVYRK